MRDQIPNLTPLSSNKEHFFEFGFCTMKITDSIIFVEWKSVPTSTEVLPYLEKLSELLVNASRNNPFYTLSDLSKGSIRNPDDINKLIKIINANSERWGGGPTYTSSSKISRQLAVDLGVFKAAIADSLSSKHEKQKTCKTLQEAINHLVVLNPQLKIYNWQEVISVEEQ